MITPSLEEASFEADISQHRNIGMSSLEARSSALNALVLESSIEIPLINVLLSGAVRRCYFV